MVQKEVPYIKIDRDVTVSTFELIDTLVDDDNGDEKGESVIGKKDIK